MVNWGQNLTHKKILKSSWHNPNTVNRSLVQERERREIMAGLYIKNQNYLLEALAL